MRVVAAQIHKSLIARAIGARPAALPLTALLLAGACQVGTRPSPPEPASGPGLGSRSAPSAPRTADPRELSGAHAAPAAGLREVPGASAALSGSSAAPPGSSAVLSGANAALPGLPGQSASAPQAVSAEAAAVPVGGPAAMYRGDAQHTGRSPFTLPISAPQERWRFATQGSITAAPAVASDGTIVVGSHDGVVYALTALGLPRWRYRTADMVWATPALAADGTLYVGSDDDRLHALSLSDGALRWTVAAGTCKRSGGRSPEGSRCDVEQVTLGADGTLYIGGDGIYAVRSDGKVRWHFDPASGTSSGPAPSPEPAHRPSPGLTAARKIHCGSAPSVARNGTVYAICQEVLYALGPDGSKRWEFSAQGEFESAPALGDDGLAYLGGDDRRLYALDALGQLRFMYLAGAPIRTAVALGRDGSVVFGCDDNAVYSVRGDGTLGWSFRTADTVRSSPLIDAAGSALFGSRDDRLYAVTADGKLKWSVVLDSDVDGAPTLGPDGTIYIGADDQALHALR